MRIWKSYRTSHWLYYLGFILLGFSLSSFLNLDIIKHILLGAFLLAYAFSLNDYYDKTEKKKMFILPLLLSFFILPMFNYLQLILSLIFLIIVTFYSMPPIKLKSKPIISSLSNGLGFTTLFFMGYSYNSNLGLNGLLFGLFLFSLEMTAQFIHEIVHLNDDRKKGNVTTIVFYGKKLGRYLCYLFLLLSLLICVYLFYVKVIKIMFFIATILFVTFFVIDLHEKEIDKNFRRKYRVLGTLTGLVYFISIISGV